MNILLAVIVSLIVIGHTASALLDGAICRVLTCITIFLHPAALLPMLLLKLPFEAVAILFLSSALYYLLISLFFGLFKKKAASGDGGDES